MPLAGAVAVALIVLPLAHRSAQSSTTAGQPARSPASIALVEEAIAAKQTPGAVVLVGRGDESSTKRPTASAPSCRRRKPMTLDTIFDLASLTKVVATTTAVMRLVEQGRIRLNDPVASFIPGFERYGKGDITVRHLLTHVSGLRPDVDLATRGRATRRRSSSRATKCRPPRRASASSTATSTSSCSATSSRA